MLYYPLPIPAFSTARDSLDMGTSGCGAYQGFNLTHYCGDDSQHVSACRKALCRHLHIADRHLLLPRQTHGTTIVTLTTPLDAALFPDFESIAAAPLLSDCDALVTDLPHHCIGISTADCVPILLYDPCHRAIGALHAGWRGMKARLPQHVVSVMSDNYGSHPADLLAVIGPSISLASFEVGDEVYEAFRAATFPMEAIAQRFPVRGEAASKATQKWHIDLWAAATYLLRESGLLAQHIHFAGIDTLTSPDFFSARRQDIHSGRIFTGIMLRD